MDYLNNNQENHNKHNSKSCRDPTYKSKRFIEIDIAKGVAVILMVIFHYFYLCHFMNIRYYNINGGILKVIAKLAHLTFIFVVGMNLAIINEKNKKAYGEKCYKNYQMGHQFKRGVFLIGAGMIISILSYLAFGNMYVKFGILHFIGVSVILAQFIINSKTLVILIGLLIVALFFIFQLFSDSFYSRCYSFPMTCFISGVKNIQYASLDYFSIVPYFALICAGILVGYVLYKNGNKRTFVGEKGEKNMDNLKKNPFTNLISIIGKHSLLIYFIHFVIFYIGLYYYRKSITIQI